MKIILLVGAALLGLCAFIATRPAAFSIERTASMSAPPEVIFGLINDFHEWPKWSPWAHLDPSMKTTFGGPKSGPGATYTWTGNNKVGEGKMTLVSSQAPDDVKIKLEFLRPMKATNQTEFIIKPMTGGAIVSWQMRGVNGFMSKAFSVFVNVDKMVGKDFEKGLAAMKKAAEAASQ